MRKPICFFQPGMVGAMLLIGVPAFGAVNLTFTDNDATPGSTTVVKGGTFLVSVKLVSTTSNTNDKVTAVDYFLQASTSNILTIVSRNTGSTTPPSSFPDPFATDSAIAADSASNRGLNPKNLVDLGSGVSDVNAPVFNGTFEVSDFVISVSASAPVGTYTLTAFTKPNSGLSGPSSTNFMDRSFDAIGTFSVTVTPEPASFGLLGVGSLGLLTRRRRLA